jgi:hypothetical protein
MSPMGYTTIYKVEGPYKERLLSVNSKKHYKLILDDPFYAKIKDKRPHFMVPVDEFEKELKNGKFKEYTEAQRLLDINF